MMNATDLFKYLRANLPTGIEDLEFDKWIRTKECVYKDYSRCSGPMNADHILGGYQGTKANGLIKVPSCQIHNQLAELKPFMHTELLHVGIKLRLEYDSRNIRERVKLEDVAIPDEF